MEFTNPTVKEKTVAAPRDRHPIIVICVVANLADYNNDLIHSIRNHVNDSNALFMTRVYDARKFADDREYIERLPAFHVYRKKSYIKTFYPNTRPFQHVTESIEAYLEHQEAKKRRMAWAPAALKRLVKAIKAFAHRKTRMERYQDALQVRAEADHARRISTIMEMEFDYRRA